MNLIPQLLRVALLLLVSTEAVRGAVNLTSYVFTSSNLPYVWTDEPLPAPYRLRILNASNDRFFTFNFFVADGSGLNGPGASKVLRVDTAQNISAFIPSIPNPMGLAIDPVTNTPIVILRDKDSQGSSRARRQESRG